MVELFISITSYSIYAEHLNVSMKGKASATAKKLGFVAVAKLIVEFLSHDDGATGKPHAHECKYAGGYVKKVLFEQSRSTFRCLRGGRVLKICCTRGAS